ncbi:MAG: Hsp20/alpha crystallin family protein [Gaiellaceae bacterium]
MATLVRWEPFRELAALQNDMGRLMSTFLGQGQVNGENGERSWMPAVDVWETDNELVYAFDIPGISEDEISVEYDDGALTVGGKRTEQSEDDRFYRYERRFGSFSRTVGLPQGVEEDAIRADYRNGVLEIHVPKPEAPKPRRIQIGAGEEATIEGSSKRV